MILVYFNSYPKILYLGDFKKPVAGIVDGSLAGIAAGIAAGSVAGIGIGIAVGIVVGIAAEIAARIGVFTPLCFIYFSPAEFIK